MNIFTVKQNLEHCEISESCIDTDDSIPMTLDDMEDLSPAAENIYMYSSQVDGEQDFLESSPNSHLMAISPSQMVNGGSHRMNGASQSHAIPTGIKIEPHEGQLLINGDGMSSDSSILARQLSIGVVNKTLFHVFGTPC